MQKEMIVIGAGGHAEVVIDSIDKTVYKIAGILDKDDTYIGQLVNHIPIIGSDADAEELYHKGITCAVIGIGHLGNYFLRNTIYNRLKHIGFEMVNVIHPTAIISPNVEFGEGNVILPRAVINSGAKLGNNNIINTGAIIEHDVILENNIHMATGSVVCGMSHIGENTFAGAGSTIIQGIKIGANVIIGAGSTVVCNVDQDTVTYGTPAKVVKRR